MSKHFFKNFSKKIQKFFSGEKSKKKLKKPQDTFLEKDPVWIETGAEQDVVVDRYYKT